MLRNLFNVEISSFIGPSLASSGLGFLLECIKPKKAVPNQDLSYMLNALPEGYVFRDTRDERRVTLSWVYILICSALWVYICSISILPSSEETSTTYPSNYWTTIALGTLNYIIGITMLFSKETNEGRDLINIR